ncbi:DNA-directed RNA polymerase III subunit rpc3 [Erysiphe neolycopersici]|uniref:DNA-directed RNA polymerase III subunit RPC3 n=1 Tax=Erysiphe neolycopersici TaxID=212602 RepID=A0A420I822_9PEZI|nr:DNA-directed RNA polymerase III subunit rpc3 [Erysiphe neolycopersici]
MPQNAMELCSILVDEIYGELTSQIYSVLHRRGRLPIPLIAKYTYLGQRQVRHGLVVLVQQNLVFHNLDEETGLTYYEANHIAAYALIRSGKFLEAVESRYGAVARDVVQNLLLLGHTKISQLEGAYEMRNKQQILKNHDHTSTTENGEIKGQRNYKEEYISTPGQFHSTILKLLQVGVLEEVSEHMFRSPSDTYNRIEKEILRLYFGGSTKGNKQKEELKHKVRARLQSLRCDTQKWQIGVKRKPTNGEFTNGVNCMNKRRKLANGDTNHNNENNYEDDGTRLDPELIVRVNFEKCTVFLRSQKLVVTVNDRIGKTTSLIYKEALRILEGKIPRCQTIPHIDGIVEDEETPVFTTSELVAAIGNQFNPSNGIAGISDDGKTIRKSEKTPRSRTHSKKAEFDQNSSSDDNESEGMNSESNHGYDMNLGLNNSYNDPRKFKSYLVMIKSLRSDILGGSEKNIQHIKDHLMLLAADEYKFLRKCGNAGMGEWTVNFKEIVSHMREEELDTVLLEAYGSSGHRLVRILRKIGKLDEKQLPNIALMKQKDVRTKLAELQMAGIVDIQEVPKDASRSIYRTIYLWYFDSKRTSEIFIENIYKILSQVLQRLNAEREKDEEVLKLIQRSDVRDQNPEEYLDKDQLSQLASYQDREEVLMTQISRLDELVGIFRDY